MSLESGLRSRPSVRSALHDAVMPQWASTVLAVFVGGLLTYFTQRLLESRRAENERKRDDRQAEGERERDALSAAAELRVALRLVLDDLDAIALHYKMFAEEGRYPEEPDPENSGLFFPTDAWDAEKRALAAGLSDDQWTAVAAVMHGARRVRVILLRGTPLGPIQPPIVHELRNGEHLACDLYVSLAGTNPPSVAA